MDYISISDRQVLGELSKRFKSIRLQQNKTQQAISDHSGIGRATINRFESGENINLIHFISLLREINKLPEFLELMGDYDVIDPRIAFKIGKKSRQRAR